MRKEWLKRQFCNSTMSLILRIFHFLNRGEDESLKSENDIMRSAFFCNFSILFLMALELDRNQTWHPYLRMDLKVHDALNRVLRLPSVSSKRYLTNKVGILY